MRSSWWWLTLFMASSPAFADEDCIDLPACLARLREAAAQPRPDASYPKADWELVGRILRFDGAVPALVPLLADPDRDVAELAGLALREATSIDPRYLPQVRAGLDRKLGWLGGALGKMESDAAAREAVARYLVSESAPDNQEAWSVKLQGRRAVPYLVAAAACPRTCGERDHYLIGVALAEMGADGVLALPGLTALATDAGTPPAVVAGALEALSHLAESARPSEPELFALRERRPELAETIDETLVRIGSSRAGAILAARLARAPDIGEIKRVADLGPIARDAGPQLMALLDGDDWNARVAAARALGAIGYEPARARLVALLDDGIDVRLPWAAAEALASMRNEDADAALRRVAATHWYPPVRQRAEASLAPVPLATAATGDDVEEIDWGFYDWPRMEAGACMSPKPQRVPEPRDRKLDASLHPDDAARLERLAYTATVLGYGPAVEPPPPAPGESPKVIVVDAGTAMEHRTLTSQVPHIALRVDHGWLVGGNRGEWGGEAAFIGDDGSKQTFLDANVEDIYHLGRRYVAVTGIAHIGIDQGMIEALSQQADGRWIATHWRALPGAPRASFPTADGALVIDTGIHGQIIVRPDGTMRMADCHNP
jgi:HEAT repeat protein